MSEAERTRDEHADDSDDTSESSLDLFFDLVFVYAMSQVTQLMLEELTWLGLVRGALALAAVWWPWTCFAWLGAASPASRTLERALIFLAMAGVLVAATALPGAFGDGALLFGVAYLAVRVIHVALFVLSTPATKRCKPRCGA